MKKEKEKLKKRNGKQKINSKGRRPKCGHINYTKCK